MHYETLTKKDFVIVVCGVVWCMHYETLTMEDCHYIRFDCHCFHCCVLLLLFWKF